MQKFDPALIGKRRKEPIPEYRYFDTPDGDDIGKKLWCVLKPTALIALATGTADVMMHSKPKGYVAALGRYAYLSLPIMGIAATFVIITNSLKNFRNKDDYWNWALGGFASGGVLGAYKGKASVGFGFGLIFALAAIGKKNAVINNYSIIPEMTSTDYGTLQYLRHDYSLTSYRPGNYTVGAVGSTAPET